MLQRMQARIRCMPPLSKTKPIIVRAFYIMEHNMSDIAAVMKACEGEIEAQLVKFLQTRQSRTEKQSSTSANLKATVDGLSIKQRNWLMHFADRAKSTQKQDEK